MGRRLDGPVAAVVSDFPKANTWPTEKHDNVRVWAFRLCKLVDSPQCGRWDGLYITARQVTNIKIS